MDQRIADGIADRHRHTAAAPIPEAPIYSPYIYPLSQAAPMTALLQDLMPPAGLPIGAPMSYPPPIGGPIRPLSQAPLMDAPRARVHRHTRLYTNRPPLEGPRRSLQSGVGHSPALSSPIRDWGVGEDSPDTVNTLLDSQPRLRLTSEADASALAFRGHAVALLRDN